MKRSDCVGGPRPCPLVGCEYNLYLLEPQPGRFRKDKRSPSLVRLRFPDREPWDMPPNESCVLDIADEGSHTLEEVSKMINLTRERARQIEVGALAKLQDPMKRYKEDL